MTLSAAVLVVLMTAAPLAEDRKLVEMDSFSLVVYLLRIRVRLYSHGSNDSSKTGAAEGPPVTAAPDAAPGMGDVVSVVVDVTLWSDSGSCISAIESGSTKPPSVRPGERGKG